MNLNTEPTDSIFAVPGSRRCNDIDGGSVAYGHVGLDTVPHHAGHAERG